LASAFGLETRLRDRSATIAIMGLGYAGLPIAVELTRTGFAVVGYDVDPVRVARIQAGRSPLSSMADTDMPTLRATTNPACLAMADVALICVPTPPKAGQPDAQFVEAAARTLGQQLHPGVLVVL
jgi:UDP-N-acetyl-D-glucosamine dehydrogenase